MSEVMFGSVATPAPFRLAGAPRAEPSAKNCTCPVARPAPGAVAVTVAVKLTGWLTSTGLGEEPRAVAVPAVVTVWPPARVPVLGA